MTEEELNEALDRRERRKSNTWLATFKSLGCWYAVAFALFILGVMTLGRKWNP